MHKVKRRPVLNNGVECLMSNDGDMSLDVGSCSDVRR